MSVRLVTGLLRLLARLTGRGRRELDRAAVPSDRYTAW